MNEILVKINAEKRLKTGTGNSREFRSNKLIPGIIYGEKKEPIPMKDGRILVWELKEMLKSAVLSKEGVIREAF